MRTLTSKNVVMCSLYIAIGAMVADLGFGVLKLVSPSRSTVRVAPARPVIRSQAMESFAIFFSGDAVRTSEAVRGDMNEQNPTILDDGIVESIF